MAVAIFVLLGHAILWLNDIAGPDLEGVPTVSDGDSLSLNDERIRLRGIDAPELDQSCRRGDEIYACGREARVRLQSLIGSHKVTCSGAETDQYGRLLATCEAGDVELNKAMVEAGWAVAYGSYVTEELAARAARRGLWKGEFDQPQDWRAGDYSTVADIGRPGLVDEVGAFLRRMLGALLHWMG
jgi:endonuclease YncB( thermonuclease family)